jgi:hypothetical protein
MAPKDQGNFVGGAVSSRPCKKVQDRSDTSRVYVRQKSVGKDGPPSDLRVGWLWRKNVVLGLPARQVDHGRDLYVVRGAYRSECPQRAPNSGLHIWIGYIRGKVNIDAPFGALWWLRRVYSATGDSVCVVCHWASIMKGNSVWGDANTFPRTEQQILTVLLAIAREDSGGHHSTDASEPEAGSLSGNLPPRGSASSQYDNPRKTFHSALRATNSGATARECP